MDAINGFKDTKTATIGILNNILSELIFMVVTN